MTVVEREQREEEVVADPERRARVLEAAALEIEVRGWTKGSLGAMPSNTCGPVCLLGGILAIVGFHDDERWWAAAAREWSPHASFEALYGWNDHHAHDAAEVAFLLRWRAEEIRDGWDAT